MVRGEWRLRFTDSPPMIKNKGVTGLGSLPFSSYVDLVQTLNSNGTAVTSEVVETHVASTGTAWR